MKRLLFLVYIILGNGFVHVQANNNVKPISVDVNLIGVSQSLLLAAKTSEPTDSLTTILQNISPADLEKQLVSDNQKKAFWINLYNSYTQIILSKNPDQYKKRSSFFGSKQIIIAGTKLSLDDIEHGILRHASFFSRFREEKTACMPLTLRNHMA